jgi:hypothetical protein
VTLSPTELEVRRRAHNPLWPWLWAVRYRNGTWHYPWRDGRVQHESDIAARDVAWLDLTAPVDRALRLHAPPEGVAAVRLRAVVTLEGPEACSVSRRVALIAPDGAWRGFAIDDAGRAEAIAGREPWP